MRIGRLRHRVQLRAMAVTQGATGEPISAWTVQHTVWAEVRTLSGNEQSSAELATQVAQVIYRVTIRKPSANLPAAAWQVIWNNRTFEVLAVQEPDNRQRTLALECVEVIL